MGRFGSASTFTVVPGCGMQARPAQPMFWSKSAAVL